MRYRLSTLLLALAICPPVGGILVRSSIRGCICDNRSAARSQIGMLESAVEHYRLNVGTLPGTLDDLRCPPVDPDTRLRWAGPYLTQPAPFDPWGKAYRYQLLTPTNFKITSAGGDGLWLTADDIDPAAE